MSASWTKSQAVGGEQADKDQAQSPVGSWEQSRDKHPDSWEDGRMNGFQSLQLPFRGLTTSRGLEGACSPQWLRQVLNKKASAP